FSFVLQPAFSPAQAEHCVDNLKLFRIGYGWGGSCSLVMPYDMQRARPDWPHQGQLVRLYVGLEDTDDLIADLEQALATLG
ncbi:MAG TPA: PLP-dependent transferase, partial [Methylophilaceae bacterium]|nr:PLP-dependent transferase [Methylophilaceae bacterium]